MEIITLENISKKYDGKTVLNNISQTFCQGQSVAFVGYNGCGKSTLLKIISKLAAPTSGKVIYGKSLLFHYIPEKFPPVPLTAREYLMRMGTISGIKKEKVKHDVEVFANDFFMEELLDTRMNALSKGTLQKVGVIQALIKRPDILLLDEPLSGQDVESQKVFIEKINQMQNDNVTVFMSCHEKKLIDAIAADVYAIKDGMLQMYESQTVRTYTVILENVNELSPIDGMMKYGRYFRWKVEEDMCDKRLPELLAQGWRLRGMEVDERSEI